MNHLFIHMIVQNLRRHKRRTLFAIIGNFLAMTFITCILMSGVGALNASDTAKKNLFGEHHALIMDSTDTYYNELSVNNTVEKLGVFSVYGYAMNEKSPGNDCIGIGTADDMAFKLGHIQFLSGKAPVEQNEIAIEQALLDRMEHNKKVGDTITLDVTWLPDHQTENLTLTITGIVTSYSKVWSKSPESNPNNELPAILFNDFNRKPAYLDLLVQYQGDPDQALGVIGFQDQGKYYRNSGAYQDLNDQLLASKSNAYLGGSMMVVVFLIAIITCISATTSLKLSMRERMRQLRMMKTIGTTNGQLIRILYGEVMFTALVALPFGAVAGYGCFLGMKQMLDQFMQIQISPVVNPVCFIAGAVLILVSLLGATAISFLGWNGRSISQDDGQQLNHPEKRSLKTRGQWALLFRCVFNPDGATIMIVGLIAVALFIGYPIQYLSENYADIYVRKDLRGDCVLYMTGLSGSGALDVQATPGEGFGWDELEFIRNIDGIRQVDYTVTNSTFKVIEADQQKLKDLKEYVLKDGIDNLFEPKLSPDPDGRDIDLVKRDKIFYGYPADSEIFRSNFRGLGQSEIEKLEGYVAEGSLDYTKLKSGEGAVAVEWIVDGQILKLPYNVGDQLLITHLQSSGDYSEDYFKKPDGVIRTDFTPTIIAKMQIPFDNDERVPYLDGYDYRGRGDLTFFWDNESFTTQHYPLSVDYITLNFEEDADIGSINKQLKSIVALHPETTYESLYEQKKAAEQFKEIIYIIGRGVSLLMITMSLFLLYNIITARVQAKRKQFGLLRMIGADQNKIKQGFYLEAIGIGVISALLSMGLCLVSSFLVKRPISSIPFAELSCFAAGIMFILILAVQIPIRSIFKQDISAGISNE